MGCAPVVPRPPPCQTVAKGLLRGPSGVISADGFGIHRAFADDDCRFTLDPA